MDISTIKSNAKAAFKANYWRCVLVAFLIGLLTMGTAASTGNSTQNASAGSELSDAMSSFSPAEAMVASGILAGAIGTIILVTLLLRIFIFNPLEVGGYRFFRQNAATADAPVGAVLEGFGGYGRTFITLLLRDIFLFLWTMLFVIPGIIKSYSYMLVPYILKDNPELSAIEAISRSKELMNGNKWKAFVLDLSFIGWFLLSIFTLGILNIFWTNPYRENAKATLYLNIIGEK